jgi:regulatory protein
MSEKKKFYSKEEAYRKALDYCALQERCHQEVRDKLYYWGLHKEDVEALIAQLITEGFLNEERFAIAFAGGKLRIIKYGKVKIKNELKLRKVSNYCIRKALAAIDENDYVKILKELINKKDREIKETNEYKRKNKLALYAISRGFESELVWQIIAKKFGED